MQYLLLLYELAIEDPSVPLPYDMMRYDTIRWYLLRVERVLRVEKSKDRGNPQLGE